MTDRPEPFLVIDYSDLKPSDGANFEVDDPDAIGFGASYRTREQAERRANLPLLEERCARAIWLLRTLGASINDDEVDLWGQARDFFDEIDAETKP